MTVRAYSISPSGEKFPLPSPADYAREYARLKRTVAAQRKQGREIVVVVGVGFVGAVMAAVVADSTDAEGRPRKFVIGMQRPSPRSYWKIKLLNRGLSPVKSEDPEVDVLIERCVKRKKTLCATYTYDALSLADVVVVDVQCDYHKESLGNCRTGAADSLHRSLRQDPAQPPQPRESLVQRNSTAGMHSSLDQILIRQWGGSAPEARFMKRLAMRIPGSGSVKKSYALSGSMLNTPREAL